MIKSKIIIKLGSYSYPIFIEENIINNLGEIIKNFGNYSRYLLITDTNVAKLYLKKIEASFKSSKLPSDSIILKPGEKTKSFYHFQLLLEKILEKRIDRNSILIAIGGGVIGDIVGLASSVILRGVPYIQVPTTLLAQVDSAVGGKTGINSKFGKNLIGTFKQPLAVISSINTLKSLGSRQVFSGYAEILKYALIDDKKFFNWLQNCGNKLIKLDNEVCIKAIKKGCEIKSKIVIQDEKERGIRAFLNLGHTFAHSLESITNYSNKILHGEAVLVGMLMAIKFSIYLKLCNPEIAIIYQKHLQELNIKYLVNDYKINTQPEEIYNHMLFDKKNFNGKMNLILIKNIGQPLIHTLKNKKILINFLRKEVF